MNRFKAVKKLLKDNNESLVNLARHCNCGRDNIYKTLNSKVTKLDNPTMIKIAEFFGITVGALVDLAMTFDEGE